MTYYATYFCTSHLLISQCYKDIIVAYFPQYQILNLLFPVSRYLGLLQYSSMINVRIPFWNNKEELLLSSVLNKRPNLEVRSHYFFWHLGPRFLYKYWLTFSLSPYKERKDLWKEDTKVKILVKDAKFLLWELFNLYITNMCNELIK